MVTTWTNWSRTGIVLLASLFVRTTSISTPVDRAIEAFQVLNSEWYDCATGLWGGRWWNSANTMATFADFGNLGLLEANKLDIDGYIHNTFVQAQERGFRDFVNNDYEDEGFWALALIRSYDFISDKTYLDSAVGLFNHMQTGAAPGGGLYASVSRDYMDVLVNEAFFSVAAALSNRIPQNTSYKDIAMSQLKWLQDSDSIDKDSIVSNNYKPNRVVAARQGVILGGLSELARITGDIKYLQLAADIALAGIKALSTTSNQAGVLKVGNECEIQNTCPGLQQGNGIFIRNLFYLHHIWPHHEFQDFIFSNAESIWQRDRNGENKLGANWTGPYINATAFTQSGALDALVAAVAAG